MVAEAGLDLHFALLRVKERFGSVQPSPAALIRAAFDCSSLAYKRNKQRRHKAISAYLKCFDNNDTVSNSFIWFHSKNETIKREVKLSF